MNEWQQKPMTRLQAHLLMLTVDCLRREVEDLGQQLEQVKDELDHTQGEIWSAQSNGRP